MERVESRAIAGGSPPRGKLRGATPFEESPDCIEQGVLSIRKDTAVDIPREDQCNRNYTAVGASRR